MTITITVTYQHIKSHLQITSMYIRAWLQDSNHTIPIHFNFHSQKKRCPMPLLVISLTKRHSASHFEWFTIFLTKHRHRLLARLIGLFHTMISQHHPQPHPYTFLLLWDTSGEVEALVTYPITDPISQLPRHSPLHVVPWRQQRARDSSQPTSHKAILQNGCLKEIALPAVAMVRYKWMIWMDDGCHDGCLFIFVIRNWCCWHELKSPKLNLTMSIKHKPLLLFPPARTKTPNSTAPHLWDRDWISPLPQFAWAALLRSDCEWNQLCASSLYPQWNLAHM